MLFSPYIQSVRATFGFKRALLVMSIAKLQTQKNRFGQNYYLLRMCKTTTYNVKP